MSPRCRMSALVGAVLLAIAQVASAENPPAVQSAQAAPAQDDASGAATIVFFRPSKLTGWTIGFKVREGETVLGRLRNGTYFVAHATPGTHEYTVHSEAKDVLTMEVEVGETYYVQGTLGMGAFVARPNIAPSDAATFESMKAKLKDSAAQKDTNDDKDDQD
jgi:hypothetical protein